MLKTHFRYEITHKAVFKFSNFFCFVFQVPLEYTGISISQIFFNLTMQIKKSHFCLKNKCVLLQFKPFKA